MTRAITANDGRAFRTLRLGEASAHVLHVEMDRPESLNALNTEMGRELVALFEGLALDSAGIRCVVLTGAGERAFCAGGDLKERRSFDDGAWKSQHLVFERMARALLDCPVPVVAAVNGVAYGGGCEIAGCCDFVYAADHARFALPEVKLGIMPGAGGTQTLARALGERRAKELILSGRSFTAREACDWGLVNAVYPADELRSRADETAREIAVNAPVSVRQAKHSIHRGLQMSLRDGLAFEIEAYNRTVVTADRREGVNAFNEKRPPRFEGR